MEYQPAIASIQALVPYQPGKPIEALAREFGLTNIIKLASNENPYGPSPRVIAQYANLHSGLLLYPEGDAYLLKNALSQHWDLPSDYFIVGNGSEDIIDLLFRFCVTVGDDVVIPQYSFPCYGIRAQSVGATVVWAKSEAYRICLETTLGSITPKTKLICLATPNNPTGQWIDPKQVLAWIQAVPQHILILLDEAYYEYLNLDQLSYAHQWLDKHPNILITRTFSKIYGLAGARLGYGIGKPELIQWLNRIRQPFNTSRLAQQLGVVALSDQDHVKFCQTKTVQERIRLHAAVTALGLNVLPSHANFITIETGKQTEAINQGLLQAGIITRPLKGFNIPGFLRVSIGKPEECDRFLKAFTKIWETIA